MTLRHVQKSIGRLSPVVLTMLATFGFGTNAAADGKVALGAQVGTTGIGAEVQYRIAPKLVFRGTLDWLSIGTDRRLRAINYGENLHLLTGGAFFDWHPFRSWVLLSGGAYFGQRELNLNARLAPTITIDNTSYSLPDVGTIRGNARLDWFAPFAGIGVDNTFVGKPGWGFKAMIGVVFNARPDVLLTSSGGSLSADPTFRAHLANESGALTGKFSLYHYYPVVTLGMTYGL